VVAGAVWRRVWVSCGACDVLATCLRDPDTELFRGGCLALIRGVLLVIISVLILAKVQRRAGVWFFSVGSGVVES